MKRFLLIIGFLLIAAPALAAGFSTAIEDLPLMDGMREMVGEEVIFDKPAGRIVETTVETRADASAVLGFYAEALPALGWSAVSNKKFRRGHEELEMTVDRTGSVTVVHFSLSPRE